MLSQLEHTEKLGAYKSMKTCSVQIILRSSFVHSLANNRSVIRSDQHFPYDEQYPEHLKIYTDDHFLGNVHTGTAFVIQQL